MSAVAGVVEVGVPVKAGDASAALAAKSVVRFVTCDSAMFGISAATSDRNVGAPVAPFGPAKTLFAAWLVKLNERVGVVVAVATLVLNSGERLPELKLVTVPVPDPGNVWPGAKVIMPV